MADLRSATFSGAGGPYSSGHGVNDSNLGGIGNSWGNAFGLSTAAPTTPWMNGDLIQDPATGLYVNRQNNKIYSDPQGMRPVSNLDLQGLTARGVAVSNNLYGQAQQTQQNIQGAIGDQRGYVASLQDVVNGTAPSAAANQLQTTLGNIRSNQLSLASGAGGNNMVLANQNAAHNISNASIQAGNDAATLRAGEAAGARQLQGQTLGGITNTLAGQYGEQLGAGQGAGAQALQSQSTNTTLDQANKEINKKTLFGDGSNGGSLGGAVLGAL